MSHVRHAERLTVSWRSAARSGRAAPEPPKNLSDVENSYEPIKCIVRCFLPSSVQLQSKKNLESIGCNWSKVVTVMVLESTKNLVKGSYALC